jgi:tetratricopeptide (TPR) repeat protein
MNILKNLACTAFVIICSCLVLSAQTDIIAGKQMLQAGENRNNAAKLIEARTYFEKLIASSSTPPQKTLALYYAGYACYRLVNTTQNDTEREAFVDAGIKHLETCVQLDKTFADGHALLAGCYGRKAGMGMMNAMKYGSKSGETMQAALQLAPNNPRAMIMSGTSLYYRPAMFGGDKKKAVELWQRAAQILDETPATETSQPSWGHEEAYAWLGQAFADEGNKDAAKAAYERALEINPEYGWVKNVLMPNLAKK